MNGRAVHAVKRLPSTRKECYAENKLGSLFDLLACLALASSSRRFGTSQKSGEFNASISMRDASFTPMAS
ncbi:hypothetical protein HMPREF0972_00145 [Actinomyces sp. oral taxon 848 str. F0332]|nr:hypothetical protein HMPREF0972_00145 [Actinomyces sp. oral taxon 848 str. F0332]